MNNPYLCSKNFLENHHLPYDTLVINAFDKTKVCKQYQIDFFLDDNIKVCDDLNKNGIQAYVINTHYNQNEKTSSKRVDSLKEFGNIVLNHAKKIEQVEERER